MRKALVALLLLAVSPAFAADLVPLYEVVKKPAYRHSLDTIFKGETIEPWVSTLMGGDGLAEPGKPRAIGGAQYELYWACKEHDCGDNTLNAVFTPGGGQAWAVLTKGGAVAHIYGHPDAAMKQALLDAAKKPSQ